jgi:hypothetical protein
MHVQAAAAAAAVAAAGGSRAEQRDAFVDKAPVGAGTTMSVQAANAAAAVAAAGGSRAEQQVAYLAHAPTGSMTAMTVRAAYDDEANSFADLFFNVHRNDSAGYAKQVLNGGTWAETIDCIDTARKDPQNGAAKNAKSDLKQKITASRSGNHYTTSLHLHVDWWHYNDKEPGTPAWRAVSLCPHCNTLQASSEARRFNAHVSACGRGKRAREHDDGGSSDDDAGSGAAPRAGGAARAGAAATRPRRASAAGMKSYAETADEGRDDEA